MDAQENNTVVEESPAGEVALNKKGKPIKLRPGTFGIILGRHKDRPSQWHALIGGMHFSVSNCTIRTLKTEEEFLAATHDIEDHNKNIDPEEWVRVMRSSLDIK